MSIICLLQYLSIDQAYATEKEFQGSTDASYFNTLTLQMKTADYKSLNLFIGENELVQNKAHLTLHYHNTITHIQLGFLHYISRTSTCVYHAFSITIK